MAAVQPSGFTTPHGSSAARTRMLAAPTVEAAAALCRSTAAVLPAGAARLPARARASPPRDGRTGRAGPQPAPSELRALPSRPWPRARGGRGAVAEGETRREKGRPEKQDLVV